MIFDNNAKLVLFCANSVQILCTFQLGPQITQIHSSQLSSTDLVNSKMANIERKLISMDYRKLLFFSLFCFLYFYHIYIFERQKYKWGSLENLTIMYDSKFQHNICHFCSNELKEKRQSQNRVGSKYKIHHSFDRVVPKYKKT